MRLDRRRFILSTLALPSAHPAFAAENAFASLEAKHGGRLGVAALDSATGQSMTYRQDERFPLCSTFKLLAAAAVLANVDRGTERLNRRIAYSETDLLEYAPVTRANIGNGGMTVGELCAAAIELSDNTAGNLLLAAIGGPAGFTSYARSLGDAVTRLDRNEPTLNTAIPGDPRDTTTPAAIAHTLEIVLTKGVLSAASVRQLEDWMIGDKVADARLRAGLPKDWSIGDKTGTGDNGTANVVAIIRPPNRKPLFAASYLTGSKGTPAERNAVHAEVGRVIGEAFGN